MRALLLSFLLLSISLTAQTKFSKARIHFNTDTAIQELIENGISADHGLVKNNQFIESVFSDVEIEKAESLGYEVSIVIDDAKQHYIDNVRNAVAEKNASPCDSDDIIDYEVPANFNLGSMGGFLTYDEILSELNAMQDLYPDLITLKAPIGDFLTIENRPIYWLKISDNPSVDEDEPEILYDAIHHAREPGSVQQLIFYMWYLLENYATDTDIQQLVNTTEMYFVPVINVDGYIYNETTDPDGGGMWRKNRRNNGDGTMGVDLNRNYSYHWGEAGTSDSAGQTYPGAAPFSEPETQAIKWFCEEHNFIMALNAHTYSQLLLYPYGYDYGMETPDHETFGAISEIMVSQNGYNNILSSELYPASGDSDDWMYGDTSTHNKIFSMTPEIGDSFWPPIASIIPICKEMVYHNLMGAKLIHNYADVKDILANNITESTGNFTYTIQRLGLGESGDFTVSVVPISANITSVGAANNYVGMEISELIEDGISYVLDESISVGDIISYKLVVDNGAYETEKIITKIYGNFDVVFFETADTATQWDESSWAPSTSEYYTADFSMADSPYGNYSANQNSSIEVTEAIDLTALTMASVSFYAKWDIENNWDYVQFEISTDDGSTWQPQCGNYTNSGVPSQGVDGEPLYDGTQTEWVFEEIDLSDYIGESIKFRFQLVSDEYEERDGFFFDDLSINTIPQNTSAIADAILENVLLYPNPTKDVLNVILPHPATTYSLHITTVSGQLVSQNTISKTHNSIAIDELTTGVYFVKIFDDSASKTLKMIVE